MKYEWTRQRVAVAILASVICGLVIYFSWSLPRFMESGGNVMAKAGQPEAIRAEVKEKALEWEYLHLSAQAFDFEWQKNNRMMIGLKGDDYRINGEKMNGSLGMALLLLGRDGWELVATVPGTHPEIIFKRRAGDSRKTEVDLATR